MSHVETVNFGKYLKLWCVGVDLDTWKVQLKRGGLVGVSAMELYLT